MAKQTPAEVRQRWDALLQKCRWTGKIPAGTDPDTSRRAVKLMEQAQAAAKRGDWSNAEIQVRGAVAQLVHAVDSPPARAERARRERERDATKQAARAQEEQRRLDLEADAWDRDRAWAIIAATIRRVGSAIAPCPADAPNTGLHAGAEIDQAWKAQDMARVRVACERYESTWTGWWAEQQAERMAP